MYLRPVYVAIGIVLIFRYSKIIAMKFLENNSTAELEIHQCIQDSINKGDSNKPTAQGSHGHEFIIQLQDSFKVIQEDRKYAVLVLNLAFSFDALTASRKKQLNTKLLLFQLVQGLQFLHQTGITHGGKRILTTAFLQL